MPYRRALARDLTCAPFAFDRSPAFHRLIEAPSVSQGANYNGKDALWVVMQNPIFQDERQLALVSDRRWSAIAQ